MCHVLAVACLKCDSPICKQTTPTNNVLSRVGVGGECCKKNRQAGRHYCGCLCTRALLLLLLTNLHAVRELRSVAVDLEHGHLGLLEGAVALGPEARGVLEARPEREMVESGVYFVVLLVRRVCKLHTCDWGERQVRGKRQKAYTPG